MLRCFSYRKKEMLGLPHVKSCGQKDLADDGVRKWDDQVQDFLNSDYPDWQHPSKTYMVPQVFAYKSRNPDVGEKTEKNFFDLLLNFGESRNEKMFVVHSYRFAELISELDHGSANTEREKSKKWLSGEHDFVIIHRQHGVVFFQVKAAIKKAKVFAEAQKQIAKDQESLKICAQQGLKGKCKELTGKEVYSYPGFVVMPNCPKDHESVTRPSKGIFAEDCENVDAFSEWWDKNIMRNGNTSVDQTVFNSLVMRFVGVPHLGHSIDYCIDKSHRTLVFKTKEQLEALLNTTSEQWITGPAGSGKTWLLMEKVKILAEKALLRDTKEKILVVCFNKPLSKMFLKTFEQYLTNSLPDGDLSSVLEVKTFDKLICDITGSISGDSDQEKEETVFRAVNLMEQRPVQYDHIFVDECQDLYGDWPVLFKKLLKDVDELSDDDDDDDDADPKHMWFLYDSNQYLRFEQQHQQYYKSLKRSTKLTKVLRNTENIFQQSRKYYKSTVTGDPTLGHRETGLAIKWDGILNYGVVTEREGAEAILKHIHELRQHKVQEKDICILVNNAKVRDKVSSELQHIGVESQKAETLYEHGQNKIVVESIWRFKGLESKVVILYNPPYEEFEGKLVKRTKQYLYTAVSRCICYLVVIATEFGCRTLQSDEGVQTHTFHHLSPGAKLAHRASDDDDDDDQEEEEAEEEDDDDDDDDGDDDEEDDDKDEQFHSPPKISRTEGQRLQKPTGH
ncbi:hypothetical protein ACROYT_G023089 [Oculina patagonica]